MTFVIFFYYSYDALYRRFERKTVGDGRSAGNLVIMECLYDIGTQKFSDIIVV